MRWVLGFLSPNASLSAKYASTRAPNDPGGWEGLCLPRSLGWVAARIRWYSAINASAAKIILDSARPLGNAPPVDNRIPFEIVEFLAENLGARERVDSGFREFLGSRADAILRLVGPMAVRIAETLPGMLEAQRGTAAKDPTFLVRPGKGHARHAVRDGKGQLKEIQTYKRTSGRDEKRRAKVATKRVAGKLAPWGRHCFTCNNSSPGLWTKLAGQGNGGRCVVVSASEFSGNPPD